MFSTGIVWIFATKTFRCRRHQLHQPLSACVRACVQFILRFLPDDRVNESRVHTLILTSFKDDAVQGLHFPMSECLPGSETLVQLTGNRVGRQHATE